MFQNIQIMTFHWTKTSSIHGILYHVNQIHEYFLVLIYFFVEKKTTYDLMLKYTSGISTMELIKSK